MASHDPLEDYPLSYNEFYSELPGADYLNDIDLAAIYDEPETDEPSRGLSAEQVSEIARDSLSQPTAAEPESAPGVTDPQLFDTGESRPQA